MGEQLISGQLPARPHTTHESLRRRPRLFPQRLPHRPGGHRHRRTPGSSLLFFVVAVAYLSHRHSSPRLSLASLLQDIPLRHAQHPLHAPLRLVCPSLAPAMTTWTRTSAWLRSCSCQHPPQPPQAPHTNTQTRINHPTPLPRLIMFIHLIHQCHPHHPFLPPPIRFTSPRCSNSNSNSNPPRFLLKALVFLKILPFLPANLPSTATITIRSP